MYNLNYTPTTLGVHSWREIISGGTLPKKVEYHCLESGGPHSRFRRCGKDNENLASAGNRTIIPGPCRTATASLSRRPDTITMRQITVRNAIWLHRPPCGEQVGAAVPLSTHIWEASIATEPRDGTSVRPRPLPSKSFQIHRSSVILPIILIFPSYLRLGHPGDLFPSGFPTNRLYTFGFCLMRATRPTHPGIWLGVLRKTTKKHIIIASVVVDIRTEHLPVAW
jgi:hypothetical protein